MQNFHDLWEIVLEDMKRDRLSDVAYRVWFKDVEPLSFDGSTLTIKVPNIITKDVIEKNYTAYIIDTFREIVGLDISLSLVEDEEVEPEKPKEPGEEYTFENFVVGHSNRFSYAAALAITENKDIVYNPLVLYGNSGVGKTHLAMAIYNKFKQLYPEKKLLYTRAEEFTSEVVNGIQTNTMDELHTKYRQVDLWLLDDIHFIAGKESTQEEFFNTFNALYQNHKQIIVTSDRAPKEIKSLEDRIRSRLEAGLLSDIQPPEFETRAKIVQNKAKEMGIVLDNDLVYYIAEQIKMNIRQLEGVVKKLEALIRLEGKQINKSDVQAVINEVKVDITVNPITPQRIIEEIGRTYSVNPDEIVSQSRTGAVSKARKIAMYVLKRTTDFTLEQIGEPFSRNHATVSYAINDVEETLKKDPREKEIVEDIIKNLQI